VLSAISGKVYPTRADNLGLIVVFGWMPRYVECIRLPLREYQFEEIARIAVAVPGVSDQEKRSLFKLSVLNCGAE
jgi:hypothetical protein